MSDVFVGRERELRELRSALEEAARGQGRLVLVSGGPGIGKTRLVEELASEAASSQRVLWGRCWEGEGAPPFWPWVQALRSYVAEREPADLASELGADAAIVAQLVPQIRERIPGLEDAGMLGDPEQARARLFDAIASFLRSAARTRPLLVVFDDLHWADRPSLLLTRYLARNLRDARILLVGAYRDVELRSATGAEELLADLSREIRHLELRGLSLGEVKELVGSVGGDAVGAQVAPKLHAATDGNPLFLGEVLRSLSAEDPKEWPRVLAKRAPVPPAVRTAIRTHLGSLTPECRRILGVAAVIGREFELPVLDRASESRGSALARIDEAIRAGLVTRVEDSLDRYRFSHALVQEALYDDLGAADRPGLHRRAGEALEAMHPRALPLADLAHHYFEASLGGETKKAIDYAKRSAGDALRLLAYEEGVRQLERALTVVLRTAPPDEAERCEILIRLGEPLEAVHVGRARKTFREAAALADAIGDGERLARAALGLGGLTSAYPVDFGFAGGEQVRFLERALSALGEGETDLHALVRAHLASALVTSPGAYERSRALQAEAVRIARLSADPTVLLRVLVKTLFSGARGPDGNLENIPVTREILALAARARAGPDVGVMARCMAYVARFENGEIVDAYKELDSAFEDARRSHSSLPRALNPGLNLGRAILEGRFEDAERLERELLEVSTDTSNRFGLSGGFLHTVFRRWQQGRLGEVVDIHRAANARYPGYAALRSYLVWILAELGQEAEARAQLEVLLPSNDPDVPRDFIWLQSLCLISRAVSRLGDERRAAVLYEILLPHEHKFPGIGITWFGPAAFYLGGLATTLGRFDEAERHFDLSLANSALLNSPPWRAETQHDYAKMLLTRARADDAAKARALLGHALTTARELGLKALEDKIVALGVTEGAAAAPAAPVAPTGTFRQEGEFWSIGLDGEVFRLRDSKGLRYIATLLARPGVEVHAAELAGIDGETKLGDAGEMLDPRAREQYRRRLEDLRAEAEEAESFNDAHRAAKARAEIETISRELSAAFGLGGRARKAASDSERARLMVTQRIKAALKKIGEENETVGRHLANGIRTGNFCSYEAVETIAWAL